MTNIDGKLVSVHEMIQSVEWEYNNMEVMKALRSGTDALNKIHEQMSLEDVESLLDETNEAIEVIEFHMAKNLYSYIFKNLILCLPSDGKRDKWITCWTI